MSFISKEEHIEEVNSLKKINQEQSQRLDEQSQLIEKQSQKIQVLEEEIARLKNRP